jgi:quinol monooxygenase YgiN
VAIEVEESRPDWRGDITRSSDVGCARRSDDRTQNARALLAPDVEEEWMPIKVVIEFQARPGARDELIALLESISATHGPRTPGFLGSTVYEALDDPDALVEIAEWASAQAQSAAVGSATAAGLYTPVVELVSAPFRATRISRRS